MEITDLNKGKCMAIIKSTITATMVCTCTIFSTLFKGPKWKWKC